MWCVRERPTQASPATARTAAPPTVPDYLFTDLARCPRQR
jgi:hypothetical protein